MSTRFVCRPVSTLSALALLMVGPSAFAFDAEVRAAEDVSRGDTDAYRFRTHVDDRLGAAPKAMTAKVSFTALDGGPAVPSQALSAGVAARSVFSTSVDLTTFSKASFEFQIPEKVVMDKEDDFFGLVAGGGWVDAVDPSGVKVRARLSEDGTLDMVVFNEDRSWDASTLSGVNVVVGEKSSPMRFVETRQRWKAGMSWGEKGPALGKTYRADVTLLDAKGTELDSLSDTFVVNRDDSDPGIETVRIGTTRKGDLRVVSWTSSDGLGVTALEMSVTDSETGKELIATTDDAAVYTERQASADIGFKSSPAGSTYPISATPLGADGKATGSAISLSLVVGKYDADSKTVAFAENKEGSVGFALVPAEKEGTWTLHGRWDDAYDDGKSPGTWRLIFEEPFEGPVPDTTTVELEVDESWSKWVQRADGALAEGAEAEVITTLTTGEGDVIDEVEASGTAVAFKSTDGVDDVDVFINKLTSGGKLVRRSIRTRRARV